MWSIQHSPQHGARGIDSIKTTVPILKKDCVIHYSVKLVTLRFFHFFGQNVFIVTHLDNLKADYTDNKSICIRSG